MSEAAESRTPDASPPKSVDELIAIALAMEREAAARYDELAKEMARHGNHELADLFDGLGAEERKHEAYIGRWLSPGVGEPPATEFAWRSPESLDPEAEDEADGVYRMTPYRALRLAVHNEERAFAFFSVIAGAAEDPEIRAKAEALAKEELEHVVRLRLERRRAWRAESQSAVRGAAPRGPRAVRSLAALLNRARTIEQEAALRYDALTTAAAEQGDRASADLFRSLAADERSLLAEIDRRTEGASEHAEQVAQALRLVAGSAPVDAVRLALANVEEAFDFYAAVAEQSADQDMMEEAQRLAERALERLKRIRDRLVDMAPPDSRVDPS